jgi:lysophospholipase L1-like esterase
MNDRLKNGALAGLLVLTLVLVGFSLRSPATPSAGPGARTSAGTGEGAGTGPATGSASPSPTATGASGPVVFLGDSVTEGTTASSPARRWTALVAAELGQKEVNLGHARTGYLRRGPADSCGGEQCPSFAESVADVVAAKPSTVVVTGGGNDTGLPAQDVAEAVSTTLASLRKGLPDARIYVVNPWWDLREVPDSLAPLTATVRAAAKTSGATFLDTKQPLVGQPDLMVEGGTNPNDAGHAALAKAVTAAIGQQPNA